MAEEEQTYSPAEICAWFDIPRTTLFRWEDEGLVPPAERRGPRLERVYRQDHVRAIFELLRKKMSQEMELGQRHDPLGAYPSTDLQERLYLAEFFADEDPRDGLRQLRGLANRHMLRPDTIRKLAEEALRRERGDSVRTQIWQFLLEYDQGVATPKDT